jgi:hypothetical protein
VHVNLQRLKRKWAAHCDSRRKSDS